MPIQEANYATKSDLYFNGVRRDYLSEISVGSTVLEIGCGDGATGAVALAQGQCRAYCGVELFPDAADKARKSLTQALTGDIESMRLPWRDGTFDALIFSEVLEHLSDPWAVLRKLRPLLKPGAKVFASSPNVCHYRVIKGLLRGNWTLTDVGVMDRTHLRWFTPKSYRQMFEDCGYTVTKSEHLEEFGPKAKWVSAFTFGLMDHLLAIQIDLRAHC